MNAEIISIGTELTSGQNLDTNGQWLSQRLAELGIIVGWHTTLADDFDLNVRAFQNATQRAKLVLLTGGLGPTQDDLTREALAKAAGVELVHHPESEEQIRAMFRQRNRDMPARNRVQAYFPRGADPMPNDCGTAPGVWMKMGDCFVGAMPGVPREMHEMFLKQVLPRVANLGLAQGVQIQRKINCFGAGEAQVEEKVPDLTRRDHVPEVGITASNATISMRILGRGATPEDAQAQIEPIEKTIRERLGNWVFGADDEDLQDVVIRMLTEKRQTISIAEGVTGGHLAERLTAVPGASRAFVGGLIAYHNQVKVSQLGVPQSLLDQVGAVSAEVAEAMAVGCRALFNTPIALATVGIAGPQPASDGKEVGLVYAAIAWDQGVTSRSHSWIANRSDIQSRTAKMALNLARLHLIDALGTAQ